MSVASAFARLGTEWIQSLWVYPLITIRDPCLSLNVCWSASWLPFFNLLLAGSPLPSGRSTTNDNKFMHTHIKVHYYCITHTRLEKERRVFGWAFAKLIFVKIDFEVNWFIFECFYLESKCKFFNSTQATFYHFYSSKTEVWWQNQFYRTISKHPYFY